MTRLLCALFGHRMRYTAEDRLLTLQGRQVRYWRPYTVCTRCGVEGMAGR